MSYRQHYALALLLFTAIGKADSGDDFSNNLFSDLAPLLALFGERVTMQFLSQSLGWADCIILAMAPLGVITTIVSAIRVEGPPWLKAIIGRSRENRSVAEMELMSSTSQETCELWNGDDVVRCQGLAPVKEFICLLPPDIPINEIKRIRITRLEDEEARKGGLIKKEGAYSTDTTVQLLTPKAETQTNEVAQTFRTFGKKMQNLWRGLWSRNRSTDEETPATISLERLKPQDNEQQGQEPEMVILRNTKTQAPNITLNRHKKVTRRHLYIAAAFGCIVQLGVLTYFGLTTYYYSSKFKKGDKMVLGYAFPFSAGGTILLVTGMFFCAHVVDRSTKEIRYKPTQGYEAKVVWLQPKQVLREKFELDGLAMALGNSDPRSDSETADAKPVFDFGLSKGGSWTVMMNEDESPDSSSNDSSETASINASGNRVGSRDTLTPPNESTMIRTSNIAQDIVQLRTRLAQLADWRGPASTEATQLAEAIEVTMDSLCPENGPDLFSWTIRVQVLQGKRGKINLPVTLQLKRNEGHWKCRVDELDSVLSLWLCSIDKIRQASTESLDDRGPKGSLQMDNDSWFRKKSSEIRGGLVLISQQTDELTRCLKWWMPTDWSKEFSIENDETLASWNLWRVVGDKRGDHSKSKTDTRSKKNSSSNSVSDDLFEVSDYDSDSDPDQDSSRGSSRTSSPPNGVPNFLALQSHESLERLYAKHIFYSFIWAAVEKMDKAVQYHPELDSTSPLDTQDWDSLRLQCTGLSKLARAIQTSGLMELHDSYLALIPPLHSHARLGELNCVLQMMSEKAKQHERLLNWTAAAECYQQLFTLSKYFRVDSYIYTRSVAMMLEYVRAVNHLLHDVLKTDMEQWEEAVTSTKDLSAFLKRKADPQVLDCMRKLYSRQSARRRAWSNSDTFPRRLWKSVAEDDEIKHCGFTELHRQIASYMAPSTSDKSMDDHKHSSTAGIDLPSNLHQYINTPDILGWSPLHYAACISDKEAEVWIKLLIEQGADVNATDIRDWTPLHYCLMHDRPLAMEALLEGGANVRAVGIDGTTPLHCAASGGGYVDIDHVLFNSRQSADQFAKDNLGRAPIHLAALKGNEVVIGNLHLSIGARDKEGRTALHLAAFKGLWGTVTELTLFGARVDELTGETETLLHWAAMMDNINAVRELLELRATVDSTDSLRATPLHYACEAGNKYIVDLLIQNNADVNARTNVNQTPIMFAAEEEFFEIVDRLLEVKDIDLNVRGEISRCTVLDTAVSLGKDAIVRKLVERGATISEQTLNFAAGNKEMLSIVGLLQQVCSLQNCVRKHVQGNGAEVVWDALRRALLEREEEYVPWALFAGVAGTSFCFL
ncbi:ankyrin repeat protein [Fusarium austroafricanum]|uniref:Ankyrin repeat protein n=1 Tax=Fusarium austroafricanum TaxID=2364996 RepID=A0A8H4KH14_9HYPO|nr:ankyrin repeat protein [Fusarium austroafricanum]